MSSRQIFQTKITDVDTSAKDVLGSIREEGGKFYKYVELKNTTATVAVVAGDPVSFFAVTGAGLHRVVSDATDADAQPIGAGFIAAAAIAGVLLTSYFCWVQLTGLVTVPTAVTSGVVGTGCMMATGDKTLTVTTGVIFPIAVAVTATAANNKVMACVPF